ncbi:MAG: DUF881 domain-containing protein [Actinomycetota bacterium]|nr:DUF881 domain-containing protein [Actinomycetota bacterium]
MPETHDDAPVLPPPGHRSRYDRAQVVVALLLALLGFATTVQLRSNSADDTYAGTRRGDLVQLLDSLDTANQRAQSQILELEATRRELLDSSTQTQAALEEARQEADTLAILSGAVGATGPGVRITVDDPTGQVGASVMLNVIEELRDAGAEALEINDQVRVVAQTFFADDGEGITADGIQVSPPYAIDAIGDASTLAVATSFPGGLEDIVATVGGTVEVELVDEVEVTALSVSRDPDYARPAD